MILRFLSLLLGLLAFAHASAQSCTTTLNPGANVGSAAASAAAGSTICLNSGSYGNQTFGTFTKSPRVVVQAVTPLGASMGATINGANGLTLSGIQFNGINLTNSTTRNITVQNSHFGTTQFDINTVNFNANNILIDNNYFGKWDATGSGGKEGRLSVTWSGGPGSVSSGVVITNNIFEGGYPGGCSDGVHLGSYGVVVGPGNQFLNITQGSCGPHVDAIQGYGQSHTTITGNYFLNNSVSIGFYDGGASETITNNVLIGGDRELQLGGINGMSFAHNTMRDNHAEFGSKLETSANSNWIVQNNIWDSSDMQRAGARNDGCGTDCVVRYNLLSRGGTMAAPTTPTNTVTGNAVYIGGGATPPSTWAGWQLAPGSPGENAGNDGQDIGTTFYGTATGPAAPANFRLIYTFPPLNYLAWRHHHGIPK